MPRISYNYYHPIPELLMLKAGDTQLSYESFQPPSPCQSPSICCPDNSVTFSKNTTTLSYYQPFPFFEKLDLQVTVHQDSPTHIYNLTVSPVDSAQSQRSAQAEDISVSGYQLADSSITRQRMEGTYVIADVSVPESCVVTPMSAVTAPALASSKPNVVGMSEAAWVECFECGQLQGSCTALTPEGRAFDPFDQLDLYRGETIEKKVKELYNMTCEGFVDELTDLNKDRYPTYALDCLAKDTLYLHVRLDGGLFTIQGSMLFKSF